MKTKSPFTSCNLIVLKPVSQPDPDTLICQAGNHTVTLRKRVERFDVTLSIQVRIDEYDVRVHHATMTNAEKEDWATLESKIATTQLTEQHERHTRACRACTAIGLFPS